MKQELRVAAAARHPGPLWRRSGESRYRFNGRQIVVRNGTRDLPIVAEIFGRGSYEPPAPVAAMLDGRQISVLDVGGNIGAFGVFAFGRWDVVRLVSLEPDPANAAILNATMHSNQLAGRWTCEQVAVSNRVGTLRFAAGQFSESRAAEPGEQSIVVPTIDLFDRTAGVDLLKMDIEGGEWPILNDPRLAELDVPAIVMEWHRRACTEQDARGAAQRLLRDAGYNHLADYAEHDGNGLLWAWR